MPIRARRRAVATRVPSGRALLLSTVAALVAVLAGCGSPEYTYVTNSEDRTYVKLPTTWRQIDEQALTDAIGIDPAISEEERGLWLAGYDADSAPSPMHLFGPSAPAPAAIVAVQQVPETVRGQYSLDKLRDLFYPVTAESRDPAALDPTSDLPDFALVSDEVLTPGDGLRGVRSVFRYRIDGGPLQMIDQTNYLNDDASKLYMLFVRCSTECYEKRQQEIDGVVSSFTVREST